MYSHAAITDRLSEITGPVSGVRPKSVAVTVDDGAPVEVGGVVGGGGNVILFKLNDSPPARQFEDALGAAHRTDISTASSGNVHVG